MSAICAPAEAARELPGKEMHAPSGRSLHATNFYIRRVLGGNPRHPLVAAISDGNGKGLEHRSVEGAKAAESSFLVQKYRSNAILLLTSACPQKCSYCFRKGGEDYTIPRQEVDRIFEGFGKSRELVEIILSGGDPLFASPGMLEYIRRRVDELNGGREIPVLVTVHTRLPVVSPFLLNGRLLNAVIGLAPGNMDLHIIHPDEITEGFLKVCKKLSRRIPGLSMRTIHPLLRGVNNDAEVLKRMYTALCALVGIVPRDLIISMPEPTPPHLMVGLAEGMGIGRELSVLLPGHLLPRLVVCSPIYGKSYVDPFHQKKDGGFVYDMNAEGFLEGMHIKDGSALQHSSACMP